MARATKESATAVGSEFKRALMQIYERHAVEVKLRLQVDVDNISGWFEQCRDERCLHPVACTMGFEMVVEPKEEHSTSPAHRRRHHHKENQAEAH